MFQCKVITDSVFKTRLTTVEITYPRFIHAEIMTHRDRARNAGSSRAIPWNTMKDAILGDPVVPIYWGSHNKGMQTGGEVGVTERIKAEKVWLDLRDAAVVAAQALHDLGVHKSLCNRLTEPWMWITVVMTSTNWENFFAQRCHPDAEIHFQTIAGTIRNHLAISVPTVIEEGGWHLPYLEKDDHEEIYHKYDQCLQLNIAQRVSVARCARVSYVQHGDKKKSIEKDLGLAKTLIEGSGNMGHRSPFEHVAQARQADFRSGPFRGWHQLRKDFWTNDDK